MEEIWKPDCNCSVRLIILAWAEPVLLAMEGFLDKGARAAGEVNREMGEDAERAGLSRNLVAPVVGEPTDSRACCLRSLSFIIFSSL